MAEGNNQILEPGTPKLAGKEWFTLDDKRVGRFLGDDITIIRDQSGDCQLVKAWPRKTDGFDGLRIGETILGLVNGIWIGEDADGGVVVVASGLEYQDDPFVEDRRVWVGATSSEVALRVC